MRVLAIDPGYGRCGMAVVEKATGGKETLVFSSCVETSSKEDFPDRLRKIVNECSRLIETYAPNAMAIETLYLAKNQKTAMRVAEVRGALISMATTLGLRVFEYTPGQIKNAASGWGGSDKRAVARMLHVLLAIQKDIVLDDEYDAIAVGVTHLAHYRA